VHILYLEDQPNDANLVKRYVQTTPHDITVVDTIQEANAVLSDKLGLILVDLLLGDSRSGFDFVREVRQRGYNQPIIAVTALVLPQEIEQCFSCGCNDVISKPYAIKRLDELFNKYSS
jgi:CheY-like chemotaxis protein